jgi:hypothetical protein
MWSTFKLVSLVVVLGAWSVAAHADAFDVVVPNWCEDTEGSTFMASPFHLQPFGGSNSMRYQQIQAADQFSIGTYPEHISGVSFRIDRDKSGYDPTTYQDVEVRLSTTSIAPEDISAVFADNTGPDETVVFAGELTLSSDAVPGEMHEFDVTIDFTTPFLYDPGQGHLLVDIINPHNTSESYWDFEYPAPGALACVYGDYDALEGDHSYQAGYVIQVHFVPACSGDIDGDGDTDHSDLGALLAAWCTHEGDPHWNADADLDGDGHVGHGDLGILLADWGCGT